MNMMCKKSWLVGACLTLGVALTASPARAQGSLFDRARDFFDDRAFALQAGGGFANFTERGAKALTAPGGSWTVRTTWGMARRLGVEVGYLGAALPMDVPGVGDAAVVQTGLEAMLRLGLPLYPDARSFITPYLTGGLGWSAFNMLGADPAASTGMSNSDGVFSLPIGFGVSLGYDRLSLDARLMYRPAFADEMFRGANQSIYTAGQNTLGATAAFGYSF
jgi:hypothetical protein